MGRACSTNAEKTNSYRVLVANSEGKRRDKEDKDVGGWIINIKKDLKSLDGDGMDWIYMALGGDRWSSLVNTVMQLRVPRSVCKFLQLHNRRPLKWAHALFCRTMQILYWQSQFSVYSHLLSSS